MLVVIVVCTWALAGPPDAGTKRRWRSRLHELAVQSEQAFGRRAHSSCEPNDRPFLNRSWRSSPCLSKSLAYPLLNPTLLAIILISLGLEATHIPYEVYLRGADVIHFMLGPAVVLLAVPLFRQRAVIRASARLIAVGLAVGLPVGVLSAVGIAWVLGASSQTILSLAPKSVTAGIAVGISEQIGGLQTLTIVLVIMTGITGAVLGPIIARLAR